ncbi:MAG: alkaline phosphatase family protein [Thermoleophilaceae bacterium]
MTDLRDPQQAEALAYEAPDEYLRRREFLQRTAVTAGLATGLATVLNPDTLVAEAARTQRRKPLPSPRNMPIDTFVVLMMENRSFDHYLGWMPNADGRQAGLKYKDKQGKAHSTHRLAPDFQGCAYSDPDHSFDGGREELNNGKMDGFRRAGDNDDFAIGYYDEKDIPFLPAAAKAFTTYDRFFCSILASTFPNREYMHAAQSYGKVDNNIPSAGFKDQGFPDSTIFAKLKKKGIDGRYYYVDEPVSALWGARGLARSNHVEEYYARCASGTLAPLSFVDPSFANEGGGTSGDEHPHGDIRAGQAYMSDVVHAFMESPQWKRGVIFVVYDEWGGFFDHVRPPRVPDIRSDPNINKDFGQMGFRIPAVAISPYVKRGHVNHGVFGFESILKMIEYRFGVGPLTRRDAYAHNIARSFDFQSKPRLGLPSLPDPPTVAGAPCALPRNADYSARAKPHDMTILRTSGYLERLGVEPSKATASAQFREPTKIEALLRSSA